MTVLFVLFGMNYIIAMTANAFAEDIQASLNAGMNAHLAKPLDMDEVLKTIAPVSYTHLTLPTKA